MSGAPTERRTPAMASTSAKIAEHPRIADARARIYHIFVRDLVLPCSIGVHPHERAAEQRVRINLDLAVRESDEPLNDDFKRVVNYEKIADRVRRIIARGHVQLVETLAEAIATACLEHERVRSARVRIEKLDILPDADSVGVEIERVNPKG